MVWFIIAVNSEEQRDDSVTQSSNHDTDEVDEDEEDDDEDVEEVDNYDFGPERFPSLTSHSSKPQIEGKLNQEGELPVLII